MIRYKEIRTVKTVTLFKRNFLFHKRSRKHENETESNFNFYFNRET